MAELQSWTCDRCGQVNLHQQGVPCKHQNCATIGCQHPRCPPWIIVLDQHMGTIIAVNWRQVSCHYGDECPGRLSWCLYNHTLAAKSLVRLSSVVTWQQAKCITAKLNDTWAKPLAQDTAEELWQTRVHDLEMEITELQRRLNTPPPLLDRGEDQYLGSSPSTSRSRHLAGHFRGNPGRIWRSNVAGHFSGSPSTSWSGTVAGHLRCG